MSAWAIHDWLTRLDVDTVIVENVPEFTRWGPLLADGRPDPRGRGKFFEQWFMTFGGLGYEAEWRRLNAADYGDATSRERLFIMARRDGRGIRWPEPTHQRPTAEHNGEQMFPGRLPWRGATEIIDWTDIGRSILDHPKYVKTPLKEKSRRRIARGIAQEAGPLAPLFIDLLGLCAEDFPPSGPARGPFVLGQQSCAAPRGTGRPLPTIATAGAISLVQPMVLQYYGTSNMHCVSRPLATVTAGVKKHALVATALVELNHGNGQMGPDGDRRRTHPVEAPLHTITTNPGTGLATASFLTPNFGESAGQKSRYHRVDHPLPTVTSRGACNLVSTDLRRAGDASAGIEELMANGVEPRRIVLIDGQPHILDIRFRMLKNSELAKAMGFDAGESEYEFAGNKSEVTRQIGNAVPVRTAAALVKAALEPRSR